MNETESSSAMNSARPDAVANSMQSANSHPSSQSAYAAVQPNVLSAKNPFPGLRPFAEQDSHWFFGREKQTSALYRLVDRNRFTTVVGSSGSGKSSLVRAGLLPLLLRETKAAGGRTWRIIEMRPGIAPMMRLAAAIAGPTPETIAISERAAHQGMLDRVESLLRATSLGVADALQTVGGPGDQATLILVDQFEEIFRYDDVSFSENGSPAAARARRDEAHAFVSLLIQASRQRNMRIHIVLTMRSDYIGDCSRYTDLPEIVTSSQYLVPALSMKEREQVIRGPVELSEAKIDDDLVARLLNDSSDELDQLPVLQHVMMRLWDEAQNKARLDATCSGKNQLVHLRMQHYYDVGGLQEALSNHANSILADLYKYELAVEQTFRALVKLDRGRAVRRAVPLGQLKKETGCPGGDIQIVVDRFRQIDCAFLTPLYPNQLDDATVVDIGHEALIRRWSRIFGGSEKALSGIVSLYGHDVGWLWAETVDGNAYLSMLDIINNTPPGAVAVLPSEQLQYRKQWWRSRPRTAAWAARYGGGIERVEQLFDDSTAALGRRKLLKRLAYCGFAVLGVAVIVMGVYAMILKNDAEEQKDIAVKQAERLAVQTHDLEGKISEVAASGYWRRLNQSWGDILPRDEVRALWDLALESNAVRSAFAGLIIDDPKVLPQLGRNPDPIIRAVGLVWPGQVVDRLMERVRDFSADTAQLESNDQASSSAFATMANVRAVMALVDRLPPDAAAGVKLKVQDLFLSKLRVVNKDGVWVGLISQGLTLYGKQLDRAALSEISDEIKKYVLETVDALPGDFLARSNDAAAIAAVYEKLDGNEAIRAVRYLSRIAAEPAVGGFQRHRLARPLIKLADKIDVRDIPEAVQLIFSSLVQVTKDASGPSYPLVLAVALDHLVDRVKKNDAIAVKQLNKGMIRLIAANKDVPVRDIIACVGVSMVSKLGAENFVEVIPILSEIVSNTRETDDRIYLSARRALMGGSDVSVRTMLGLLQPLTLQSERGYRSALAARVLTVAAPFLSKRDAMEVADVAMEVLKAQTDVFSREAIARLLAAVTPKLPRQQRSLVAKVGRSGLAGAAGSEEAMAWAALLIVNPLEDLNSKDRARTVIELLKYPTATGETTRLLLEELDDDQMIRSPGSLSLTEMALPSAVDLIVKSYELRQFAAVPPERPEPLTLDPAVDGVTSR